MAELTPDQYAELVRKLDDVCRQAQELSKRLRGEMAGRARGEQQLESSGGAERRRTPRNRRFTERRAAKRPDPSTE